MGCSDAAKTSMRAVFSHLHCNLHRTKKGCMKVCISEITQFQLLLLQASTILEEI